MTNCGHPSKQKGLETVDAGHIFDTIASMRNLLLPVGASLFGALVVLSQAPDGGDGAPSR